MSRPTVHPRQHERDRTPPREAQRTHAARVARRAAIEAPPPAPSSADSPLDAQGPGQEQRRAMIAEAAYYRAEQRGFEPGYELDDWLQAERDIERASGDDSRGGPARCGG